MLTSEVSPPRAAFLDQHPCQSALWKPITQSGIAKLLKKENSEALLVVDAITGLGTTHLDMVQNWYKFGFVVKSGDVYVESERAAQIP